MKRPITEAMVPALWCATLIAVTPASASSQTVDCRRLRAFAVTRGVDPVYEPAQELSRELERRGFTVRCILRSQWQDAFDGLAGRAASFQTDRGRFSAMFLSPPQTFDSLVIVERREESAAPPTRRPRSRAESPGTRYRYIYLFAGRPKPWPDTLRFDSAVPWHFVKDGHRLIVTGDGALAARLRQAAATPEGR